MKRLLPALLTVISALSAMADTVTISWEPPVVTNGVTGYQVSVTTGNPPMPVFQSNVQGVRSTQQVVNSLTPGVNYIGTVRSINGTNLFSPPISAPFTIPSVPVNIQIKSTMQQSDTPYGPWVDVTNQVVVVANSNPKKFYRSKLDTLNYP